jgi:hypothetical protein
MSAGNPQRRRRLVWFADLEALSADLGVLEVLRDEAGLTTVAPESHISHTSGFRVSPAVSARGPFEDWATRPGLADHRRVFGAREPAMAVLPGVVGGVDDDAPLFAVLDECRRLGLEVWGHAGVWCYGAEVFPEYAAVDLLGRSALPASLPWGSMFCPSHPVVRAWIVESITDAAARYDLDGWFLDHARHPSPAFGPGLLGCACRYCGEAAATAGVDLDDCRRDVLAFAESLRSLRPADVAALGDIGPAGLIAWLGRWPGILRWLDVRATILADRFGELGAAVTCASRRPIEYGSDVFPPSVALLGGHDYAKWARCATYFTGGFGPKIGWGSVGRVTATALGELLAAFVPGLAAIDAQLAISRLLGASTDPDLDEASMRREVARMAAVRTYTPVYPPIPGPPPAAALARTCDAIVDADLDGAMVAGLESAGSAQRRVLRESLMERLAPAAG